MKMKNTFLRCKVPNRPTNSLFLISAFESSLHSVFSSDAAKFHFHNTMNCVWKKLQKHFCSLCTNLKHWILSLIAIGYTLIRRPQCGTKLCGC